jgi:hypothetical protein
MMYHGAAIFYLLQYRVTGSNEYLHKAKRLLNFLLHMAAPNGYYYNFIWPDGSINKVGNTSPLKPPGGHGARYGPMELLLKYYQTILMIS